MLHVRRRAPVWTLVATVAFVAPRAEAAQYEMTINVADEEELLELFVTGQISEDTWDALVELHRRGVDLSTATREELYSLPNLTYDDVDAILAYREDAGVIHDPADLVAADALSKAKLEGIAPFLRVVTPDRALGAADGRVRFQTVWSPADEEIPSSAIQMRVSTLRHLTVGASGVLTRARIGDVRYDPNRDALAASPASVQFHVPKYFAQWDTHDWGIIAGTYRVGFGQRLTFDNSDRFTPNGFYFDDTVRWNPGTVLECKESAGELGQSPCAGPAGDRRITSDFRWRESLTGVAVGAHEIGGPDGWAQVYAWASYQTRSIGQYEIYDRARCDDPRNDGDPACAAPFVFRRQDDPLAPTSRFSFQTLPNAYVESLGGANVSWFFDRRTHVGVTGYGAKTESLVEGAEIDFQEWSSRPFGGPYGALGADAAWGQDWADVFLEVARSFDHQLDGPVPQVRPDAESDGGGYAGIVRTTATWKANELELVGRWYDDDYANPFARPIAAPDELDGNRARDELGGRLRYNGTIEDRFYLRTSTDFWVQPTESQPKMLAFVRGDVDVTDQVRPGLWVQYQNKDLRTFDRAECFSVSVEFDERGEPIPCGGEQLQLTPRLRVRPSKRFYVQLQYQHEWVDDPDAQYDTEFRQDLSAFALVGANPIDPLRLRARIRYFHEDLQNRDRLERSLWYYADVAYRFDVGLKLRVRYDVIHYLDDRASTADRDPNPEHWARLELEQRF